MEIPLLLAARLSLFLHYLHENRENNRIIFVEGLDARRILKSAKIQPLEKCARKLFFHSFRLENSKFAIGNRIICVGEFEEQAADRF